MTIVTSISKAVFGFFLMQVLIKSAIAQTNIVESIIPAAPKADKLGKCGTYSVETLTDIPDISFPLYQIGYSELKLPITLAYTKTEL